MFECENAGCFDTGTMLVAFADTSDILLCRECFDYLVRAGLLDVADVDVESVNVTTSGWSVA